MQQNKYGIFPSNNSEFYESMDRSEYNNWKKEKQFGITKHKDNGIHKDSTQVKLVHEQVPQATIALSEKTSTQMQQNRDAIKAVIDCFLFLDRQSVSARRHTDERSNFCEFLKLFGNYNSNIAE